MHDLVDIHYFYLYNKIKLYDFNFSNNFYCVIILFFIVYNLTDKIKMIFDCEIVQNKKKIYVVYVILLLLNCHFVVNPHITLVTRVVDHIHSFEILLVGEEVQHFEKPYVHLNLSPKDTFFLLLSDNLCIMAIL